MYDKLLLIAQWSHVQTIKLFDYAPKTINTYIKLHKIIKAVPQFMYQFFSEYHSMQ